MSEMDTQITERAIRVVRQLAHVAVERGELANDLGFELDAAAEKELGRRFHQLAGQARYVFDACDREAALLAEVKANAAAEEKSGEEPVPADPWGTLSTDPWAVKPNTQSVMGMVNRLSVDQRAGSACLICNGDYSEHFGRPSAVINGHHMTVHCDPNVCTQVLAARLNEEVPF